MGLVLVLAAPEAVPAAGPKLNVLFIAVDDLRPEAGCYGNAVIKTPALDAIAARGTVFHRAYCQQAVCSPSRTSLLLGRRPDTTKVYDLQTHFRLNLPDAVPLPQQFKAYGYHTQGLSKVFHDGLDDPQSWTVPHWRPDRPNYGKPESLAVLKKQLDDFRAKNQGPATRVLQRDEKTGLVLKTSRPAFRARGPAWEDPDVPEDALPDGQTTQRAMEALGRIKDTPFFFAVGYYKPHLPFVAPKKYYDLYRRSDLKLVPNPFPPKDCPDMALSDWGELRAYAGVPKSGPLPDAMALDLIHGYYAAASYTDAQIGRLLEELRRLELDRTTIVVVWGDHGWQLGEHGLWCKHTNFEIATRSPLLVSAPGQKRPGGKCQALVEFVDIFPTLCELCGVPIPDGLEGTSFAPLLDNPELPWKTAAFSQYPRSRAMGYTMRTDRYRYTEWRDKKGGDVLAREVYDHQNDPQENVNLAGLNEHKGLVQRLGRQLAAGWQAARPGK